MARRAKRSPGAVAVAQFTKQSPASGSQNEEQDRRLYTPQRRDPSSLVMGRAEIPDEIIQLHGSYEGLGLYRRQLRQFAFLSGIIGQRIDRVLTIPRLIVAGDPQDAKSTEMAEKARHHWRRVRMKNAVLAKMLLGQFVGFMPVEKVFTKGNDGQWAPTLLYDLPPESIKFGPSGEVYFVTQQNPMGELVPDASRRLMFYRGGSAWSEYGEAELQDVYLALWFIQQLQDMALQAIEELGRPIPVIHIPRNFDKTDRQNVEANASKQFKYYLTVPTDDSKVTVEFPSINVASSGGAGRSEYEAIRFYERWCRVRLLGTDQTQDKTGGSRALEDTRDRITDNKTLPVSEALDEALNVGWMKDYIETNYPNEPEELHPYFESDASPNEDLDSLHTRVMDAVAKGERVSRSWWFRKNGVTQATGDADVFGENEKEEPGSHRNAAAGDGARPGARS